MRPTQQQTQQQTQQMTQEVTTMTSTVLDRRALDGPMTDASSGPSLGDQHDQAERFDERLLPCRSNDPELFFAESPSDVELAKALCLDCPVQALCLAGALTRREPWGVWGGQLFIAGVVVARKRPRGRPRKDADHGAAA